MRIKDQSGMTMYEILVIIGLLGIFSVYSVWHVTNVAHRQRAKDLVRVSDLSLISEALEEYYADYQILPGTAGQVFQSILTTEGQPCVDCLSLENGWLPNQLTNYLEKFPVDPDNHNGLIYRYTHNGSSYLLDCVLELPANVEKMSNDGGLSSDHYELGSGVGVLSF